MNETYEIVEQDVGDSIKLLKEIGERSSEVNKYIRTLIEQIKTGQYDVKEGIDFLDVKCGVMAGYLADLVNIMLVKCSGESIQNNESLLRIVEDRTVLERMKPIEDRLKYQINKYVQAATTGTLNENDPLRLKPNPSNLVSKVSEAADEDNEDKDEDDDSTDEEKKTKVYVPPKLAPTHFEGDLSADTRREIHIERAKRRALNTGLMRDLQEEFSEAPVEIVDAVDVTRTKTHKVLHDKTEFEEERFVRLPETRKEKHLKRTLESTASLNSLTHFRDVSVLQTDAVEDSAFGSKRKQKSSKSGSGKKKRKSKR